MKVKIIANKPIDNNCSSIEEYIGMEFGTYVDKDGDLMAKVHGASDFVLFDGEYEIIEK
jgi:hypothetical protein